MTAMYGAQSPLETCLGGVHQVQFPKPGPVHPSKFLYIELFILCRQGARQRRTPHDTTRVAGRLTQAYIQSKGDRHSVDRTN